MEMGAKRHRCGLWQPGRILVLPYSNCPLKYCNTRNYCLKYHFISYSKEEIVFFSIEICFKRKPGKMVNSSSIGTLLSLFSSKKCFHVLLVSYKFFITYDLIKIYFKFQGCI